MKKLITTIIVLGVIVGGYYYLSQHARVSLGILEGKTVESYRGDLVVPITASGKIEPLKVVQIKGKASGEVIETPFNDGDMVKKGDIIVKLDPKDEQRNADRARAEYERAHLNWLQAQLLQKIRETESIAQAEARVDQARAQVIRTTSAYNRFLPLTQPAPGKEKVITDEEWAQRTASKLEADASLKMAEAELAQARLAIDQAKLDVKTALEGQNTATKSLEDAEERLRETTVYSPINGMILKRHVQIGEMVQSGTTSLTGGTVLMEIAEVSDIYAVVNVDEADIGQVRELAPPDARPGPAATQPVTLPADLVDKDQRVEVTVESFREEQFEGVIERIAPQSQVMQAIATFQVWIRITSDNRSKLIGLLNTQAEAHFTVNSVRNAILVSYDAIKRNPHGEGHGVYVQKIDPETQKPEAEFKLCKFGMDNGIDVEVIEGLDEGAVVYTQLPMKTRREKEAEKGTEEE